MAPETEGEWMKRDPVTVNSSELRDFSALGGATRHLPAKWRKTVIHCIIQNSHVSDF